MTTENKAMTGDIRAAFLGVLHAAVPVAEWMRRRPDETEVRRIILDKVETLLYEPMLPFGDTKERDIAKHLRRLAYGPLRDRAGRCLGLAEAYERVYGWYYTLKVTQETRDKLMAERQRAEDHERDLIWFLTLALKGTPTQVAPFEIWPMYVLVKPDGSRERLVKLRNIRGEISDLVGLDSKSFTAPRDFRRWLADQGNYGWMAGERELQAVQQDVNFMLGRKEVIQVVAYGSESPGDLWFFDDVAFAKDGSMVEPDDDGVFWHGGKGFTFLRGRDGRPKGEENQNFSLSCAPKMHPGMGLWMEMTKGEAPLPATGVAGGGSSFQQAVSDWRFVLREGDDEPGAVETLLGELNARLKLSMGGWEGTMLMAATVAFFAGPELFRWRGEFPGIFISGEKGGGKTFMARWLMGLMGYATLDSGIGVLNSTPVGLQIASGQSANMPCWADEYRDIEAADGIRKTLHAGYNRELPVKWAGDGRKRTIRTNFLVTGETSIADAATMSRYISVVMSREKRRGTDAEQRQVLAWLVANREMLFAIGRVVMKQRAKFAAMVREQVGVWDNAPDMARTEPRGRYIHGVVMGAALALNTLMPFMAASEVKEFRAWMREHCYSSEKSVAGQVNVNEFWTDVLAASKGDAFGETSGDMRRIFKVVEERMAHPPGAPLQKTKEWMSVRLYFLPDPTLDMLRLYKRRMGQNLALSRNDLRAQMSARPYWVASPNGGIHKQKFESGGGTECCWCIDLDKHELGYCPVSDTEYEASLCLRGDVKSGEFFTPDDWVDPRRGDMYALIDRLKKGMDEKK